MEVPIHDRKMNEMSCPASPRAPKIQQESWDDCDSPPIDLYDPSDHRPLSRSPSRNSQKVPPPIKCPNVPRSFNKPFSKGQKFSESRSPSLTSRNLSHDSNPPRSPKITTTNYTDYQQGQDTPNSNSSYYETPTSGSRSPKHGMYTPKSPRKFVFDDISPSYDQKGKKFEYCEPLSPEDDYMDCVENQVSSSHTRHGSMKNFKSRTIPSTSSESNYNTTIDLKDKGAFNSFTNSNVSGTATGQSLHMDEFTHGRRNMYFKRDSCMTESTQLSGDSCETNCTMMTTISSEQPPPSSSNSTVIDRNPSVRSGRRHAINITSNPGYQVLHSSHSTLDRTCSDSVVSLSRCRKSTSDLRSSQDEESSTGYTERRLSQVSTSSKFRRRGSSKGGLAYLASRRSSRDSMKSACSNASIYSNDDEIAPLAFQSSTRGRQRRTSNFLELPGNPNDLGQLVILPSTFIGSPRHMNEYAQDAMTYVARYGRPDLFITFTCNPAWEEISKQLLQGQSPMDRHDVVARVFRQKLLKLMDLVTKSKIFGEVKCHMLSIEWQKRGLPHAHILIWLNNKILPTQIDSVISAEIPDPETDPVLHNIILRSMIHGPCGVINPKSPCMKDGRCTKNFPKQLLAETVSGNDGYPLYRRRKPSDGGYTAKVRVGNNEIEVDNSWVVPYNPLLSKAFSAHINVEVCNSVKSIKYICKYLYKGSDKAIYGLASEITTGREANDEITKYQSGRYISSDEAVWRIFGFPIHQRYPAVVHLTVHLDGGQRVYYTNRNAQEVAATPPDTTLTAFFKLCQNDTIARTLLYHEVPQYYTWNKTSKLFSRRLQGVSVDIAGQIIKRADTLGRVYTVHPNNAECFYLRMLLHVVKGPRSYNDIKTISGSLCQTFREACQRLGLLEEDNQWEAAMDEAVLTRSPNRIRLFFAIILSSCSPSNPKDLWEKFKKDMSEDILHRLRAANPDLHIEFNAEIFNESLIRIENICISMCNKNVEQLGLDAPNHVSDDRDGVIERVILRERNYNVLVLQEFVNSRIAILNVEQRQAYNSVINHISSDRGALIFLDAPGGTGKTFLLNLILASVRKDSGIALAVASSGIAATLLDGGRTAHSTLKIPLDISSIEHPVCNISKSTGEGKLLKECKLIVWDECTMAHKKSLEALNRTLKDIKDKDEIMGGIVLLLAGDFRQILPVVKNSTPSEELDACLKVSNLWGQVVTLSLTTNMRVQLLEEGLDQQDFTNTLLNVGNGTSNVSGSNELILTSNLCQRVSSSKLLISKVYPNFQENFLNDQWLQERALLAPTNDIVLRINSEIAALIVGNARTYLSVDTVMDPNQTLLYATEFLNSLEIPGLPSHKLILKVGVPIMLLRNIDPPMLCNGTRLRVNNLLTNIIEATILTVPDHVRPRVCSLPDRPYNPRVSDDLYRLRHFSISKGTVVNCGDSIISKRSRSNTSVNSTNSRASERSPFDGSCCGGGYANVDSMPPSPDTDEGPPPPARYRIVLLGDAGVGKTALVSQFMTSEYMHTYDASLDDEFGEKTVSVLLDDEESELVFIDHPSVEMSCENSLTTYEPHACIIVYSVVDKSSFKVAEDIINYVWRENISKEKAVILVGNKADLARSRAIPSQEGKSLAMSRDAKFIETSSGIQHNVDELLVGVLKQIRLKEKREKKTSGGTGKMKTSRTHISLHLAKEILHKICFSDITKSRSCENLHVL